MASCMCIGLLVYLAKWHKSPRFVSLLSWAAPMAWIVACFSLYTDLHLLWKMHNYVLSEALDCAVVNERGVFWTFMPFNDIFPNPGGNLCLNYTLYFSPQGPDSPMDPTTSSIVLNCFGPGNLSLTQTPPPATQMFTAFFQSLQLWENSYIDFDINPNSPSDIPAFLTLCQRFPSCRIVTENNLPICAVAHDESLWSSKTHYKFLIVVLLVLIFKLTLEAGKLCIIMLSVCLQRLWQPSWTIAFIRDSPCLILFQLCWFWSSFNPWRELMQYKWDASDFWRQFVINGVFNKVPMMGLTIWWFKKVTQMGLGTLDYFSLFSGLLSLLYILARIPCAIRQARLSHEINLLHELVQTGDGSPSVSTPKSFSTLSYVALQEKE